MDSLTAALAIKALDSLSARASATAENIANAQTPGYRPVRVRFEDALAQAAKDGSAALRSFQPALTREAASIESIRLDLELADASTTSARYAALIEVLGRQMQISALAVSGGR